MYFVLNNTWFILQYSFIFYELYGDTVIYLRIRISVIQKPRRICYPSRWLCTKLDSTKSAVPLCHWCLKNPLIFLISVFDKFLFYADEEIAFNWLSVAWHSDFHLDSSFNSTRYIPLGHLLNIYYWKKNTFHVVASKRLIIQYDIFAYKDIYIYIYTYNIYHLLFYFQCNIAYCTMIQ